MKTRFVSKDEHRSFGGWRSYMNFTEILNDEDEVVAMVSEELGTIWTPQCLVVLNDENNQVIRCELMDYTEDYVVVRADGIHVFPIADPDELAEAVRARCSAFNMKTICQRANVSYDGFRQWKRGSMKWSPNTLASILCHMDWA